MDLRTMVTLPPSWAGLVKVERNGLRVGYLHDPDDTYLIEYPPHYTFDGQVFTYTRDGRHGTMHVQIGKLWRRILQAGPRDVLTCAVLEHLALHIVKNNGVERPHINRIGLDQLRQPGLLLRWDEDEVQHTVIDGNHRYVWHYFQKLETMDFYEVTLDELKPCLLNLPEDFNFIGAS